MSTEPYNKWCRIAKIVFMLPVLIILVIVFIVSHLISSCTKHTFTCTEGTKSIVSVIFGWITYKDTDDVYERTLVDKNNLKQNIIIDKTKHDDKNNDVKIVMSMQQFDASEDKTTISSTISPISDVCYMDANDF